MVRFMSFSSGSCGNCYYIGNGEKGLLIDAGVSLRRLKKYLEENGLSFNSFDAVLVTHDHLDHIRHLASYCKKLMKPVYAPAALHSALACHTFTSGTIGAFRAVLEEDSAAVIAGFSVRYFEIPHDAAQTVGYFIEIEGHKFFIMTDVGHVVDRAAELAAEADTVVIESNYDVDMLMGGHYTHDLKMRISGGNGHLSNDECASAVRRFVHPGLRNIFLCHLSENNNTPQLAYNCVSSALKEACGRAGIQLPSLRCLPRRRPSELFML